MQHQIFMYRIGTAGWSVPTNREQEGTHLHRYSRTLPCVEINSSFYRPHRAATWAKWAKETPPNFRFSIKAPMTVTHEEKLCNTGHLLKAFFEQIEPMHAKVGPILFQLPPSLSFDLALAEDFFSLVRELYKEEIVLEPRHATWFTTPVNILLKRFAIARAAVDPPKGDRIAAVPGGDTRFVYYRLHGSPRVYYSNYENEFLAAFATEVRSCSNAWIIFDNTALSHAYSNALRLQVLIGSSNI